MRSVLARRATPAVFQEVHGPIPPIEPVASIGYLPWMDGMRALAVLAVIGFHEMISQPGLGIQRWTNAGDLGVDVFFAVSGFLITSLLLSEARERGGIQFAAFYVRRMRRLLPALATLLIVIAAAAIVVDQGHHRTQTLHHVFVAGIYLTNWVEALSHYRLHELNHTWSLATEEQFYLVWPLVLTGLLAIAKGNRRAVVGGVALITVVALAWPEVGAHRGWTFDRLYYGLDTRAAGLAMGGLLATAWSYGLLPRSRMWIRVRRLLAAAGFIGLLAVMHDAGVILRLSRRTHVNLTVEIFALTSAATLLIIWELIESHPHLGHRLLSWAPLRTIGRISYGLYLWDALIVVELSRTATGIHNRWLLMAVHLGLTFAAAGASWFLIERHFYRRRQAPLAPVVTSDGRAESSGEGQTTPQCKVVSAVQEKA